MPSQIDPVLSIIFHGGLADGHMLDAYDAATSLNGLSRTLAIIGHYYITGDIIAQAPRSKIQLVVMPSDEGSYKQTIAAAVVGGIVAAPFTVVATKMIEGWFPPSNPQLNEIIHLLKEQNRLKREELRCESPKVVRQLYRHERIAEEFLEQHREKTQIIRSITSQSFKNIFRPIGRSAHQAHLVDGPLERPFGAINEENIAMLAADEVDKDDVVVWGVMNTFSPPSQTGIMYSRDYETTFRVEYNSPDKLPRQNDFSWSLYMGKPIRVFGRFVRYFDGNIKKFLAVRVERVTDEAEIESYFKR